MRQSPAKPRHRHIIYLTCSGARSSQRTKAVENMCSQGKGVSDWHNSNILSRWGRQKNKQNRENHKLALSHVDCGCACCCGLAKPNQDMCLICMLALCMLFPLIFFFAPPSSKKIAICSTRLVPGQGPQPLGLSLGKGQATPRHVHVHMFGLCWAKPRHVYDIYACFVGCWLLVGCCLVAGWLLVGQGPATPRLM